MKARAVATSNVVMLDVARFVGTTGLIALAGAGVIGLPLGPLRCGDPHAAGRGLRSSVVGRRPRDWHIAGAAGEDVRSLVVGRDGYACSIGAWRLRRNRIGLAGGVASRPWRWIVIVVSVVPALVMSPYFRHGLAEFSGKRAARRLVVPWRTRPVARVGLSAGNRRRAGAPVSGPHLLSSSTRNIASAQLGVFSLLGEPGEVQTGFGLLQAVGLAAYAAAAAAFALSAGLGPETPGVTVTVTVMSGWILNVLWANNLDNLLALAYVPALAVLTRGRVPTALAGGFGNAWLAAGLLHTYPELGVAILPCAAIVALVSSIRTRDNRPAAHGLSKSIVPGFAVRVPDRAHAASREI